MIKIIVPVAAALMSVASPAIAGAPPLGSAAMLDDHPAPPYNTYPECERAARYWARAMAYDNYIWGWEYIYYYESYIYDNCPMID